MQEIGLTAYIKKREKANRSLQVFKSFSSIEKYLAEAIKEGEATYNIKEWNEDIENNCCEDVTPNKIRVILNYWTIKKKIKYKKLGFSKNHIRLICLEKKEKLKEHLRKRQELARFIIEYLYSQIMQVKEDDREEFPVVFSVNELKKAYEESRSLFKIDVRISDIEDTLFYLTRIEAIKLREGFLIIYNPMVIERLEDTRNQGLLSFQKLYGKNGAYYEKRLYA